VNTEQETRAYRRAHTAYEKARAARNAYRAAFDDDQCRRLRLAEAEAEIELHAAWVALDAADESVAALDDLARRAARAFEESLAPAKLPPLESYSVDAVERHAAAIASTHRTAAKREAAEQTWFATWSAIRQAIELHSAERLARDLPIARWYIPANPAQWQELLGPRPEPPRSSSCKIAAELRREMQPSEFTGRRLRGVMPGDLEDANARERAAVIGGEAE
jgi:hypothetical protein